MTRANEYKAKGGAFQDPTEAIGALDSLLEDVKKAGEKTNHHVDKEKKYRASVSGLQECIWGVIRESKDTWGEIGLDGSFVHRKEEVQKDKYLLKVLFQHPLYEYIWLTDRGGNNIVDELIPFLEYSLEFAKATNAVQINAMSVDAKLNLPDLMSSLKTASQDLLLLRAEAERVGSVVKAATDTQSKFNTAVREYCNQNKLKLEVEEGVKTAPEPVAKPTEEAPLAEKKEGSTGSEDDDGEVVVNDMALDDLDMDNIDAELSSALSEHGEQAVSAGDSAAPKEEAAAANPSGSLFGKKSPLGFGRKPFGKSSGGKKD